MNNKKNKSKKKEKNNNEEVNNGNTTIDNKHKLGNNKIINEQIQAKNNENQGGNKNNQNNINIINNNEEQENSARQGKTGDNNEQNVQGQNNINDFYGDEMDECDEDTLRIMGININNIPESSASPKNNLLYQAINESNPGIIGMSEVGRCWHLLPEKDRWTERARGWWETSKSTVAYNTKDVAPSKYQPGGTILCSRGKACHRNISSGVDTTGLGRWSWQRYRGRHDVSLRVISAYRPCRAPGPNTVYSQQLRYFEANSPNDIYPRKIFFDDLAKEILTWKNEENDQIVLLMDVNTSESITTDRDLREFLRKTNLRDAITTKHEEMQGTQPTHHNGQHPIDGIFVSNTLHPIKCGYLPFGEFPSDHRALWIDLAMENCFGYNMPKATRPSARRLKSSDPKIRNRWNKLYADFIMKHKIHQRIFQLETMISKGGVMQNKDKEEYDKIMQLRNQGIKYADKHCRKLSMGNVPFSPTIIKTCEVLQLWKGVRTRKLGRKFSLKKIRRLEKKHNIQNPLQLPLAAIERNIKITMTLHKQQKREAQELRTTFIQGKASAMAEENNTAVEKILKQLLDHEMQRTSARRIKAAQGKLSGGSVTKIDIEHENGQVEEITTKEGIERACMDENEIKYRQTQNTPCMQEPLLSELGYLGTSEACEKILDGSYQPPRGTNTYTRELLAHMQRLPNQQPPPPMPAYPL